MISWEIPKLTISMLNDKIDKELYSSSEVFDLLKKEGYKALGWVNGGLVPPAIPFIEIYRNWSGSTTIMINHEEKCYYCIDMGD